MAKRTQSFRNGFGANDAKRFLQEISEIDSVKAAIRTKFNDNASDASQASSEVPQKPQSIEGNDSVEQPVESAPEVKSEAKTEVISVEPEVLQTLINNAIDKAVAPFKSEVETLKSEVATKDSALEQTKKALEVSEDSAKKLANVFSSVGSQSIKEDKAPTPADKFPMINTKYGVDSGLEGAARDFVGMLESDKYTPKKTVLDTEGNVLVTRDYAELTRFWKANKDSVRSGMERFAKNHGLLQGYKSKDFNVDAATLKTDLPDAFLAYLSMTMRETHTPSFIYWQFTYNKLELGKQPGDNIKVPRFSYLPTASAVADRQLTPGTPIGSSRQPLTQTSVSLTLEELGLPTPVAIPEFIQAYSMIELEGALATRLGYDYDFYNDYRIRSLYAATTKVLYNRKGEVETTIGSLAANDGCQMTEAFLNSLFAYMRGQKVPTYDNGKYALVLNTVALKQLLADFLSRKQFITKANLADITNVMNAAVAGEMGTVSGYVGDVANFMIFETNVHSLGAAGTEGAQNETIAGGAKLTRSSYAFGRNAVAKAVGMEMEIRRDEVRDFGRINGFTWLHHAAYGHLDTDVAINANQQTRVFKINTTDVAV